VNKLFFKKEPNEANDLIIVPANQINREHWLETTLKKIPSGYRILDAGAGEQQYKKFCTHLTYVSQDFAQYDGKGDGKGLQTQSWVTSNLDIVSDIISIPEPDASFDAIMCIEVFEHLPEPILAIKEFSRLLKPEGYLILTAPFCSITHMAPYHYYSGFNRYFYERELEDYGFKILDLQPNGNYFDYLIQELQRLPRISIQYSKSEPNFWEKKAIEIVIRMLENFSSKNRDSEELLTFGYHILARKIK
jgi:ubiquinone/menaquinone biosynthesis C-methylase UbiE